MPFVVALLCWLVLSGPAALVAGHVLAARSCDYPVPAPETPSRSPEPILVNR